MRIGVVGAGNIGGNAARLFARAGHEVLLSFSREPERLEELAREIGPAARTGEPSEAVAYGDVVLLSVPWRIVDTALAEAGSLDGRIVIDTTNQFGARRWEKLPGGQTAARYNQRRMAGARLVKAFNTLTAGFQAASAGRTGDRRVALFMAGDDSEAKRVAAGLVEDAGFLPVDVGGLDDAAVMEAPRRPGAVYGEEYREADARSAADAWRTTRSIPPTPAYEDA
jgi:predicted dinucleotide-binding enzyme